MLYMQTKKTADVLIDTNGTHLQGIAAINGMILKTNKYTNQWVH